MKKIFSPLALGLALFTLAGCGLKGPLYFPPADKKAPDTQATTQQQQPIMDTTVPNRNDRGVDDGPTQVIY